MANYFIDRPVFAWVLAIIMMLAGGLAIMNLPVAQYPQIAPPTITVSATYPGADAQTVEDSVTQVIEQNMNGLDGLMYMSSTSDAAGNASITLTFETGTSPDIAQVQVCKINCNSLCLHYLKRCSSRGLVSISRAVIS